MCCHTAAIYGMYIKIFPEWWTVIGWHIKSIIASTERSASFSLVPWPLLCPDPFELNGTGWEQDIRGTGKDGADIYSSLLHLCKRGSEVLNLGSDGPHPYPCCLSCIRAIAWLSWAKSTFQLAKVHKGLLFNAGRACQTLVSMTLS